MKNKEHSSNWIICKKGVLESRVLRKGKKKGLHISSFQWKKSEGKSKIIMEWSKNCCKWKMLWYLGVKVEQFN